MTLLLQDLPMKKKKTQVLVVENEPTTLMAFTKLLSTPEIVVDTAETLETALNLIETNKYLVIVADLRLSGVFGEEGLEILRYIRQERLPTNLILITGYGSPEIKNKAIDEGAAFYFEKPVSWALLQEAMMKLGIPY